MFSVEAKARKWLYEPFNRLLNFGNLLPVDKIDQMTELELGQVISSLWASQMWGNKGYLVDKAIQENGLPAIKTYLKILLWGTGDLASRNNDFRKKIKASAQLW